MYLLYSLLYSVGFLALLPLFIVDAFRHGKYLAGFRERMGRVPRPETQGRPVIWLHCVSVGEAQAARPIARAIMEAYPTHALAVSTTTVTGQQVAREVFGTEAAAVFYFPYDWAWTVRRSLKKVNPAAVLIMETELWPNFLRECRRRRVPAAVINGRLSERSFRRYRMVPGFTARVVNDLRLAAMQTEADADRMRGLGLPPERVFVPGNMKFDAETDPGDLALTDALQRRFSFGDGRPLLLAASTHAPEERLILEAFKLLRSTHGNDAVRLLIAPRHKERFEEVASLLDSSGFRWARRSAEPTTDDPSSDVILLDSIGELRAVYTLATVVFVGGSITPTGGHNILEPAAARACTVTGPHTSNFKAIVEAFLEAGALVQLPDLPEEKMPGALSETIGGLLADEGRRSSMAEKGLRVLETNRGATARTVSLLATMLDTDPRQDRGVEGARRGAISA